MYQQPLLVPLSNGCVFIPPNPPNSIVWLCAPGRWAVKLGPAAPKLLKPSNLKTIESREIHHVSGVFSNIATEMLGEDIFLRICHFLPAKALTASSVCNMSLRKLLHGSVSLWQSLSRSLLDEAVVTLHRAASDAGVDADQGAEFWRTLFRAAYRPDSFYYEHSLRERCLHSSDCFQKAIIPEDKLDEGVEGFRGACLTGGYSGGVRRLNDAAYFELRQKVLGASGHTASTLKNRVIVIGGWRPWSTAVDLHVTVLDLLKMNLSEPRLAEGSEKPERRLRHSSCTVTPGNSSCILVLGGCNDKTHKPCDGLQTLLFLELQTERNGLLQGGTPAEINWRKAPASGHVPKSIWHHAADSFSKGKRVVVFGGDIPPQDPEFTFIGDRAYANYVYILDVDLQRWERVQTKGQIPHWRSLHFGATFSSDSTAEHFVIMGGCEDRLDIFHGGTPATMLGYSLNLQTLRWKRGAQRKGSPKEEVFIPAPRMRFGAQRYGRHLLVYGGHGVEAIPEEEELLMLNTASLEWCKAEVANEPSEFGVAPAAALAGGCVLGGVELGPRGAHPVPKLDFICLNPFGRSTKQDVYKVDQSGSEP